MKYLEYNIKISPTMQRSINTLQGIKYENILFFDLESNGIIIIEQKFVYDFIKDDENVNMIAILAIKTKNYKALKNIINDNKFNVNYYYNKETLIMLAIKEKNLNSIEILLNIQDKINFNLKNKDKKNIEEQILELFEDINIIEEVAYFYPLLGLKYLNIINIE